jgi:hypothetical protein
MGITAQQIMQSDPEQLQRQAYLDQMKALNPDGSAAGALGALLGRGISNVAQGKGFFQTPDYGLQRVSGVQSIMNSVPFDPTNPAAYYQEVGTQLQQAGFGDIARMAFQEASKSNIQMRELTAREREIEERSEERKGKISGEQTTTKGIRVFRRGNGPLLVEENGQDVPYNEKKHGRFETAQDRVAPPRLTVSTDRFGNRVWTDPYTSKEVRREPGPFGVMGAPGTAPQTGQSAGQNVTTLDQLRQRLQQR